MQTSKAVASSAAHNNKRNYKMPANFYIVRSDGKVIVALDGVSNGGYSFNFIDAPAVGGAYTYSLLIRADGATDVSGTVTAASITTLLVKK